MSEETRLFDRAEDVLGLFHRGTEFARELLRENERLRTQISGFEESQKAAARSPHEWEKLRSELLEEILSLEQRHEQALGHLKDVEIENAQFVGRFLEVEEENNTLTNLYVASYQLHSSLDLGEVLQIVVEIVINLIGAERFSIYLYDPHAGHLVPVAAEGEAPEGLPQVPPGDGCIGESVTSGETYCGDPGEERGKTDPIVCIPLRVDDGPMGAIVIYQLLEQKREFTILDRELFTLLAGHAATAIFASQLHGNSKRKLNTIQGFIDLLTK